MKDSIVIFSATRARQLLKAGFQIIDIKPDRKDKTQYAFSICISVWWENTTIFEGK